MRSGFYRININENGQLKTYAYFDWRDIGFPADDCHDCSGYDMTIRYNGNTEKLWFWNQNHVYNSNDNPYAILGDGDIITWADLKCTERDFSPFWSQGLVAIPKYNTSTGKYNPQIVWGPYSDPEININYYRVYKKYGSDPWQYIVVPSYQYNYVDESLNLITGGGTGTSVQYYVRGMYNIVSQTSPTNTVTVNTEGLQDIDKISVKSETDNICQYTLFQNYPNPC